MNTKASPMGAAGARPKAHEEAQSSISPKQGSTDGVTRLDQAEWDEMRPDLRNILMSFIRRSCLSGDVVDDVLQDVWMVAYEHYDPAKGSLYSFCTTVGRNLIKDRARVPQSVSIWQQRERQRLEAQADVLTPAMDTEARIDEARRRWAMLQTLMERKHSKEARVLWAMYEHILEHDEIPTLLQTSQAVGFSYESVRKAMLRIVDKVLRAEAQLSSLTESDG